MSIVNDYTIKQIDYHTAMQIVIAKHYLHRKCPCSYAFGLFENVTGNIVGVVTYGVPCSTTLQRGICGNEEQHNVYELNRLWIDDSAPRNAESFLVAHTMPLLDREIIVSYADASKGHTGYVNQATNFIYTGMSIKFKDPVVKGKEGQHHSTFAHGMDKKTVLSTYGTANVTYKDRSQKHRYIYFNAKGKRKKELLGKLRYPVLPYPKNK